jgi:ribonuclease HI
LKNQPLNDIFDNRDSSDQISKWAIELLGKVVNLKKAQIKSQIIADFFT